jgi:hypothetical protein
MTSIANSKQGNLIMKKQYSAPKLTVHGDVAEITQILGSSDRKDFLFFTGSGTTVAGSSGNDIGSQDIYCSGKGPKNLGTCISK